MSQVGHIPFYEENPHCKLALIFETRPSLVKHLSNVYGTNRIVQSYEALIERDDIDALVISAPRPSTGPLTLQALNHRKHVLAEKPMAHTIEQASRLVQAARENDVIYSVGYMKRFDPGVELAMQCFEDLIASKGLGPLLCARIYDFSKVYAHPVPQHVRPTESRVERFETWPTAPEWISDETRDLYTWFLNAGCHDINLLHLFFGAEIQLVSARLNPRGVVSAVFDWNGCPVGLDVAKVAAGRWIEGAEFQFEMGRLCFEIPTPMDQKAVTKVTLEKDDGSLLDLTPSANGTETWSFARQARGFVDALNGASVLRNSGDEGLVDLLTIEKIWKSAGANA